MKNLSTLSLTALCILSTIGLQSCGDKDEKVLSPAVLGNPSDGPNDPEPLSSENHVGKIYFDNKLSTRERGAFIAAMDYLRDFQIPNASPELLSMMKIRSADGLTLTNWVESRVQYIMPEEVDYDDARLVEKQRDYAFPFPDEVPDTFKSAHKDSEAKTIMSNFGAGLYYAAKKLKILAAFNADNMGTLNVTSPRVGMLKVGEGLFMMPIKDQGLIRIFQAATLLHEARHSDGHGKSLAFFHAKCLKGDYEGLYACDHNYNGPYEIDALALKAMAEKCTTCSTRGKAILKILYLDSAARVAQDAETSHWDDTPEGQR